MSADRTDREWDARLSWCDDVRPAGPPRLARDPPADAHGVPRAARRAAEAAQRGGRRREDRTGGARGAHDGCADGSRRRSEGARAARLGEERRERQALARWILDLDSDQPAANAVLGRERDASGEWLTKEERVWKAGAARQAELLCL